MTKTIITTKSIHDGATAKVSLLVLKEVKKSFANSPVVNGSFSLGEGEHVALTGPSGCGKSTLLHLISGILRPDHGAITFQDTELTDLSERDLDRFRAAKIGYVFQSYHLLEGLTALENVETAVTFADGDHYPRARETLETMGLAERLDFFPSQLSVGQQQRVAVARAMVNRPPLVLADEPTASLDAPRAAVVLKMLRETCRASGAALIVVTHDPEAVKDFDRVICFREQFGVEP